MHAQYVCAGLLRFEWDHRWQTVSSYHLCGCYDLSGPTIKNLKRQLKAHEPSNGQTVKREKPFSHLAWNTSLTLVFSKQKRTKIRVKTSLSLQLLCYKVFLSYEGEPESIQIRAASHLRILTELITWHGNHIHQYLLRKALKLKISIESFTKSDFGRQWLHWGYTAASYVYSACFLYIDLLHLQYSTEHSAQNTVSHNAILSFPLGLTWSIISSNVGIFCLIWSDWQTWRHLCIRFHYNIKKYLYYYYFKDEICRSCDSVAYYCLKMWINAYCFT